MTLNYHTDEINKFDNMAPNWWDPNGPLKPLHQINPLRIKFILHELNRQDLKDLNILDVGCGGGILSEGLATLGANVTGIDLASEAIKIAELHAAMSKLNIAYQNISIENHTELNIDKQYDVITCMELLEHVPNPPAFVQELTKLLKPNGKLFVSTLNRNLKSYFLSIVAAEYILNWIPKGTHEYNKFIKPSELAKMLRANGLKINKISGIIYSIFSQSFQLSDSDLDVNYIACAS